MSDRRTAEERALAAEGSVETLLEALPYIREFHGRTVVIKYGGAAVGKSPMMPANPDLSAKDEVVKALRVHIRELSNS